jgi:hypothetical protein
MVVARLLSDSSQRDPKLPEGIAISLVTPLWHARAQRGNEKYEVYSVCYAMLTTSHGH